MKVLEKMNAFDEQMNGTLSFSWKSRGGHSNQFVHFPSASYGMDSATIFDVRLITKISLLLCPF